MFPHFKQLDQMDCGPTCLRIISKFYGKTYPIDLLRKKSSISKNGVSLSGISEAAESIGFHTQGAKLTWQQLANDAVLPCIVHWKNNHFVVVYGIRRSRNFLHFLGKNTENCYVKISDPAFGLIEYPKAEFMKHWANYHEADGKNGITLILAPMPQFYEDVNSAPETRRLSYLLGYLKPFRKLFIQIILASFIGLVLSLAFPFLTQAIVDFGVSNSDLNFVLLALVGQLVLSIALTINNLIRSWISLHVTTRVSIVLISSFLSKLMRLPISFFDIKVVGDIMQRIGDHNRIQTFLTGSLVNIIFSSMTLITYSVVMATYSTSILAIFYLGSSIYVSWILLFLRRRRSLDFRRFQHSSTNQGNIVQLINGMQEIKLNNCERRKRWEWERIQAQLFQVNIKSLTLSQNQQMGSVLIDQVKNIIISFLAAKAVIDGGMSLGMMVAVQYIIGQLNAPILQFVGFTQDAQDAKISLERLSEIHAKDDEERADKQSLKSIPESDILINNVSFQFEGPYSEKILDELNFIIPHNKITAIVGTSGSGKTTLIKMLLGFYSPVSGSIEIDKISIEKYSPSSWRSRCGVVMQDGYIFSDSISNNITVSDENPDALRLSYAVDLANIREFVDSFPMGLNTIIGVDGHGLSAGQKQRILIARAVYKNPTYIFFDEATNALDTKNEHAIVNNMEHFFKNRTVVIVAHRLSTIKKADQIIVLEKGKLIECGNHSELLRNRQGYYQLIKEQLELGK
ncbi:MAG: peptidase domain-containing ABC transporter [Cyclobacteriaceae bacterium]|nr:peptidase domain-containing ABC transporter [Cyclobacteriaceae bacterium]